jgi:hypothetical protein
MENTLNRYYPDQPILLFDLKGSFVGRKTKLGSKCGFWNKGIHGYDGVLKDLNLLQMNRDMEIPLVQLKECDVGNLQ